MMWQFPVNMVVLFLFPFYHHGYFDCVPEMDLCQQCHHATVDFPFFPDFFLYGVPLSISGIIADHVPTQLAAFGSFSLAMLSYLLFLKSRSSGSSSSSLSSSPSSLPAYTFGAMFAFGLCLFLFPIRRACSQDWFMVLTHLSCLLVAFVFEYLALSSRAAPKDALFLKLYAAVLVISFVTSCLGTRIFFFRVFFVVCEVMIMAVFCSWATYKIFIASREGGKKRQAVKSL